jgi:branched-chain amino acid transport system substrate-binding protein
MKTIGMSLFLIMLFAIFPFRAFAEDGVTDSTVLVGCSNSLSGPLAFVGTEVTQFGLDTYFKYINEKGGINGRKILSKYYDDGYRPQDALANTRKLVEQDKVFLIICPEGTAPTMAIIPYCGENKIPLLFPYAGSPELAGRKYVFTANTLYNIEATTLIKYFVKEKKLRKIGILYQDDEYGKAYLRQFEVDLGKMNLKLTAAEPVKRTAIDLSAQVVKLRQANPEAVFLPLGPGLAAQALKEVNKLGWKEVKLVSVGPVTDEKFLVLSGGVGEGVMGLSLWPDPVRSTKPAMVEYRKILEKYNPNHQPNRYNLYGYFYAMVFSEGLKRAGRNLTREGLTKALETIKNWDTGILSPITYSEKDHATQKDGFIVEVKDNVFHPVTDWIGAD